MPRIKYLIRLDDACPTMHHERWSRVESILDKYGIKPMVGIISEVFMSPFYGALMSHVRNIKALAKLKDKYKFNVKWFDGINLQEYYKACLGQIEASGLNGIFSFHPSTKNILSEYQSADFFCLPSTFEGFPNVVCEAMSCGLPVACGDVCDNPLIVDDGENGYLFDPYNVDSIAQGLEKLLGLSQEERSRMGVKAREKALKSFSEQAFAEKYINLIEK